MRQEEGRYDSMLLRMYKIKMTIWLPNATGHIGEIKVGVSIVATLR